MRKVAVVIRRKDKKDDKKDNDAIEHKGAAVAAHSRRGYECSSLLF